MTSTFGFVEEPANASAGTARNTASELKNARRIGAFTVVKMLSAALAAPEGLCDSRGRVAPKAGLMNAVESTGHFRRTHGQSPARPEAGIASDASVKVLAAAAVLAL